MTSIEWLWEQIDGIIPYQDIKTSQLFNGVLEQAKEMHKQEIIDAYNKSFELRDKPYSTADKYYQETFVSKGSDEVELPQQEISDEEINNAWEMFRIQNPNTVGGFQDQYLSFCFAIKWYREQLKQNL